VTSNNAYLRVLPIIVTSKGMAEIKPDVEAAEELNMLVLTREGLEQAINRSLIQPNADQMYTEAEQTVSAALAKYQNQGTLPLIEKRTVSVRCFPTETVLSLLLQQPEGACREEGS
jgi:hypothetical protein